MDRYPIIIYIGAAILGKVGGEMIMTDRLTTALLSPPAWLIIVVEAVLAAGVIALALVLRKRGARSKSDCDAPGRRIPDVGRWIARLAESGTEKSPDMGKMPMPHRTTENSEMALSAGRAAKILTFPVRVHLRGPSCHDHPRRFFR